ncbi:MAG: universal stress protein [Reichenbachiella sp.]
MKKILVPIDFSKESLNALEAARTFAENAGSEIFLLNVIEDPIVNSTEITGEPHYDPMDNLYISQLFAKTKERFETIIADEKFGSIQIGYKVDIGNAYSSIAQHIAQQDATLIIMGSNGASGLQEILLGSVADKVTRYAKCPVIVVKGEAQFSSLSDILFATGLQEDQDQVLEKLKPFQTFFDAHLHVYNAVTSDKSFFGEVEEKMQAMMTRHNIEHYTLVIERDNDIADSILEYAKQKNIGLIAFGTHSRHSFLHLLESKVSRNLTHHAHRPIWSVAIVD